MKLTSLPPAIGTLLGRLGSLTLLWQVVKKEDSEFKTVKSRLKNWPCVASGSCGGVGKYVHKYICMGILASIFVYICLISTEFIVV